MVWSRESWDIFCFLVSVFFFAGLRVFFSSSNRFLSIFLRNQHMLSSQAINVLFVRGGLLDFDRRGTEGNGFLCKWVNNKITGRILLKTWFQVWNAVFWAYFFINQLALSLVGFSSNRRSCVISNVHMRCKNGQTWYFSTGLPYRA
jgi:hypothetical protein